jgi:hypothetical protein
MTLGIIFSVDFGLCQWLISPPRLIIFCSLSFSSLSYPDTFTPGLCPGQLLDLWIPYLSPVSSLTVRSFSLLPALYTSVLI